MFSSAAAGPAVQPPKVEISRKKLMGSSGSDLNASNTASVVTVQEERGQQVIDTGPYAYVRHPMYAGLIPLFAGLSLIMESSATALFVIPMVVFGFLPRVMIEEATLRRDLEGYDEYPDRRLHFSFGEEKQSVEDKLYEKDLVLNYDNQILNV